MLETSLAPSDRTGEIDSVTASRLVTSPEWSLVLEEGLLVLSGGADSVFAFPDLDRRDAEQLAEAWRSGSIDPGLLAPDAREAALRLRDVGALRGEQHAVAAVPLELRFVGAPLDELRGELDRHGFRLSAEPELVVFVRTNARLVDACSPGYEALETPHLLLDLGFRETISLGPLVFPGETACLGCLVGRIAHYWGDATPPDSPAALRRAPLAVALLALEVERFAAGDHRLVNETVSISLDRFETRRDCVYRLPWCPVCSEAAEPLGSFALPWMTSG